MTTARMGGGGSGIAFIVSAGIVYEIIAAACSSPQTTEINASSRADTLMKWVNLGVIQAGAFIVVGAMIDQEHALEIIAGGGTAMVLLYCQYVHARNAGLKSGEPGTEGQGDYNGGHGDKPCAGCAKRGTFGGAY